MREDVSLPNDATCAPAPGTLICTARHGQNPCHTAYAILVMTHGPGTLTGRTPVTVKVLPSGLVTSNVFALTCRTTEPA